MVETYRDIVGYDSLYQINNYGTVISKKSGRILKASEANGYYHVTLSKNGKTETINVHKLVAITFLPNPHNLPCVNHKDENRKNNFVWVNDDGNVDLENSNLEWCTQKYNSVYSLSKPVLQFDLDGNLIREWESTVEIERCLGFYNTNIGRCCLGKQYRHTAYG